MLEIMSAYESLESTLNLRNDLDSATEPTEIIAAVSEAIRSLGGYDGEKDFEQLHIETNDQLEEVRRRVAALYRKIIVPRHYGYWGKEAQEELQLAVSQHTESLELLQSLPCKTKVQRRAILEERFSFPIRIFGEELETLIKNSEAFAQWKEQFRQDIMRAIANANRTAERLALNEPVKEWE